MTAAQVLEYIQHGSFLIVAALAVVELDGFLRAERLEGKMRAERAFKGETIPKGIVPARNLLTRRTRLLIRKVVLVAFVTALAAIVAQFILR